jgi:hypothetical protein
VWRLRADPEQKQDFSDVTVTQGLDTRRPITEALQLRFTFDVCLSCGGLVSAPPEGPCDDASRTDAALRQLHRHASDLLH